MELLSTNYGGADETEKSQELWNVGDNICVRSNEPGFLDPWPNIVKTTSMLHCDGDSMRILVCSENTGNHLLAPGAVQSLDVEDAELREVNPGHPLRPAGSTITIQAMTWGPKVLEGDEYYAYVYACHLSEAKVKFTNEAFGRGVDTWPNKHKSGVIFYIVDGEDEIRQLAGQEGTKVRF